MHIQTHPCLQLWFNFSRPFQSCLHYGVVLPVDAGGLIIEMGRDKCNLAVQSFDFLGLVNFVWNNMGPKQLSFPVAIYLRQLFPDELIIQKTGLFKFLSPDHPSLLKMRGQWVNK